MVPDTNPKRTHPRHKWASLNTWKSIPQQVANSLDISKPAMAPFNTPLDVSNTPGPSGMLYLVLLGSNSCSSIVRGSGMGSYTPSGCVNADSSASGVGTNGRLCQQCCHISPTPPTPLCPAWQLPLGWTLPSTRLVQVLLTCGYHHTMMPTALYLPTQ